MYGLYTESELAGHLQSHNTPACFSPFYFQYACLMIHESGARDCLPECHEMLHARTIYPINKSSYSPDQWSRTKNAKMQSIISKILVVIPSRLCKNQGSPLFSRAAGPSNPFCEPWTFCISMSIPGAPAPPCASSVRGAVRFPLLSPKR